MNNDVIKFLQKNDLDTEKIDDYDFSIKSDIEINPILNRYYIPGNRIKKEISISNILGYDYEYNDLSTDLIKNLSYFFDSKGSTYQTRSISMLTMYRDQCVDALKNVSKIDTVYVRECEKNKYIITDNGMHRYHVLRFHYLNELSQIDSKDKEQVKALNNKYTIPVEVQETDYIKTYSYFILRKLIPQIELKAEYNANYDRTGNVVVSYQDKQKVLTNEQLLDFLQKTINKNREKVEQYSDNFTYFQELLPTFKNFLEENQIDLIYKEVSI